MRLLSLLRVRIYRKTVGSSVSGFTISEVLVASVIMLLVFSSLFYALSSGFNVTRVTQENVRAAQILTEKMELMRLYTWQQITNTNSVPLTFTNGYFDNPTNVGITYTGTVAITAVPFTNNYTNAIRLVTISVNWVSDNIARSRAATTLVSSNGLQAYVY